MVEEKKQSVEHTEPKSLREFIDQTVDKIFKLGNSQELEEHFGDLVIKFTKEEKGYFMDVVDEGKQGNNTLGAEDDTLFNKKEITEFLDKAFKDQLEKKGVTGEVSNKENEKLGRFLKKIGERQSKIEEKLEGLNQEAKQEFAKGLELLNDALDQIAEYKVPSSDREEYEIIKELVREYIKKQNVFLLRIERKVRDLEKDGDEKVKKPEEKDVVVPKEKGRKKPKKEKLGLSDLGNLDLDVAPAPNAEKLESHKAKVEEEKQLKEEYEKAVLEYEKALLDWQKKLEKIQKDLDKGEKGSLFEYFNSDHIVDPRYIIGDKDYLSYQESKLNVDIVITAVSAKGIGIDNNKMERALKLDKELTKKNTELFKIYKSADLERLKEGKKESEEKIQVLKGLKESAVKRDEKKEGSEASKEKVIEIRVLSEEKLIEVVESVINLKKPGDKNTIGVGDDARIIVGVTSFKDDIKKVRITVEKKVGGKPVRVGFKDFIFEGKDEVQSVVAPYLKDVFESKVYSEKESTLAKEEVVKPIIESKTQEKVVVGGREFRIGDKVKYTTISKGTKKGVEKDCVVIGVVEGKKLSLKLLEDGKKSGFVIDEKAVKERVVGGSEVGTESPKQPEQTEAEKLKEFEEILESVLSTAVGLKKPDSQKVARNKEGNIEIMVKRVGERKLHLEFYKNGQEISQKVDIVIPRVKDEIAELEKLTTEAMRKAFGIAEISEDIEASEEVNEAERDWMQFTWNKMDDERREKDSLIQELTESQGVIVEDIKKGNKALEVKFNAMHKIGADKENTNLNKRDQYESFKKLLEEYSRDQKALIRKIKEKLAGTEPAGVEGTEGTEPIEGEKIKVEPEFLDRVVEEVEKLKEGDGGSITDLKGNIVCSLYREKNNVLKIELNHSKDRGDISEEKIKINKVRDIRREISKALKKHLEFSEEGASTSSKTDKENIDSLDNVPVVEEDIEPEDLIPPTESKDGELKIAKIGEKEISSASNELESKREKFGETDEFKFLENILEDIKLKKDSDIGQIIKLLKAFYEKINELKEVKKEETVEEEKSEKKKGWFGRAKDKVLGIFKRKEKSTEGREKAPKKEVAKIIGKTAYQTVTSIMGVKFLTDLGGVTLKKGDIYNFAKERLDKRSIKKGLKEFENLRMKVMETKGDEFMGDVYKESKEKMKSRYIHVRAQINELKASGNLTDEQEKEFIKKLNRANREHSEWSDKAYEKKQANVNQVLNIYIENKVSGFKIAKDVLNTALTATGFTVARGAVYAGASIGEWAQKVGQKRAKEEFSGEGVQTQYLKSAIETTKKTLKALVGITEGETKLQKTAEIVKAWGTIARGFGIYGAIEFNTPTEDLDRLLENIEENGTMPTVAENFLTKNGVYRLIKLGRSLLSGEEAIPEMQVGEVSLMDSQGKELANPEEAVQAIDQWEKAGLSEEAIKNLSKDGITQEEIDKANDLITKASTGSISIDVLNHNLEEYSDVSQVEKLLEDSKIGKGEGITHAIKRQLLDKIKYDHAGVNTDEDAEEIFKEYGYKGRIEDQKALDNWATNKSAQIARAEGYIRGDGSETRVRMPASGENLNYHLVDDGSGSFDVVESSDADKFEYNYEKPVVVEGGETTASQEPEMKYNTEPQSEEYIKSIEGKEYIVKDYLFKRDSNRDGKIEGVYEKIPFSVFYDKVSGELAGTIDGSGVKYTTSDNWRMDGVAGNINKELSGGAIVSEAEETTAGAMADISDESSTVKYELSSEKGAGNVIFEKNPSGRIIRMKLEGNVVGQNENQIIKEYTGQDLSRNDLKVFTKSNASDLKLRVKLVNLSQSDLVYDSLANKNTPEGRFILKTLQRDMQSLSRTLDKPMGELFTAEKLKEVGLGREITDETFSEEVVKVKQKFNDLKGGNNARMEKFIDDRADFLAETKVADWDKTHETVDILKNWSDGDKRMGHNYLAVLEMQNKLFGVNGEGIDRLAKEIGVNATDQRALGWLKGLKNDWVGDNNKSIDIIKDGIKNGRSFNSIESQLQAQKLMPNQEFVKLYPAIKNSGDFRDEFARFVSTKLNKSYESIKDQIEMDSLRQK